MGGNCLNIPTVRMDAITFHRLADRLDFMLTDDNLDVYVTRSYKDKDSFGDVDILLVDDGRDWREYITKRFAPNQLVTTCTAEPKQYSFDYEGAQIDFLVFQQEHYPCGIMFYSCGMFGELLGRIADTRGLKFGYFGLQYRYFEGGRPRGRFTLSQDSETILTALGLEPRPSPLQFDTMHQMFDYLLSSRYFNSTYFDLSHLNNGKRGKNKKRKEYMAFLEYMVLVKKPSNAKLTEEEKLVWINQTFPALQPWLDSVTVQSNREDEAREKFNGRVLADRLGWTGKDLSVIKVYRAQVEEQHGQYWEYVLQTPVEQLLQEIVKVKRGA